jgi:antitoxin VapB
MKATARLFKNGGSQAVRLPKEFRFSGKTVTLRRTKNGVLLQAADRREARVLAGARAYAAFLRSHALERRALEAWEAAPLAGEIEPRP